MKVVQTLALCSLLVAPSAFAQAARAARGAVKEKPAISRPGSGAKLSEGSVGSTGTVARPNLGAATSTKSSAEILAGGEVGGSCGNDLSPSQKTVVGRAQSIGITGGACLSKFSGQTKAVAVAIEGAMVAKADQIGMKNATVASVSDRAMVLDAGAASIQSAFKEDESAALGRLESLCKNGCDVTGAAFCNADVFRAARTN